MLAVDPQSKKDRMSVLEMAKQAGLKTGNKQRKVQLDQAGIDILTLMQD